MIMGIVENVESFLNYKFKLANWFSDSVILFLLGTRSGTLLFNKAMPLLFVATMSSLLYLICMKLGSIDFFQSFLSKIFFFRKKLLRGFRNQSKKPF